MGVRSSKMPKWGGAGVYTFGQYNRENVFSLKRIAKLQTKDTIFV